VGKIFDALEKFSKETGPSKSDRLRHSDYDVLMQFDASTGRIDLADPEVLKDANGIKRLMTYRLINDDGTLTPAGKAKYQEMNRNSHEDASTDKAPIADKPLIAQKEEHAPFSTEFKKALPSDWDLLMNYDRKTGNLLKYDPETGQLDEDSRKILQDPATVQRLIDNQMILPGGWLTSEAKHQCAAMEADLEKKRPTGSANRQIVVEDDSPPKETLSFEALSKADMEILLEHDPDSLKLNLNHPEIIKDPAIMKRLLDNQMIETGGKLTPQALVRCRVLTRFKQEYQKETPEPQKPKPSIGEKIKAGTAKKKGHTDSEKTASNQLKIIRLKKDETEAKPREEKTGEITKGSTALSISQKTVKKRARPASEKKFTLGKIPSKYARKDIETDLVVLINPRSFEAEQFKILRTNLLFSESGKIPRSVLVTSAVPGEGKSFVSSNLAVSVAQHVNWNVLLIDCDLRRPKIHRHFGFQDVTGLSDYLTNKSDLEPLLLKTGIENLTILPAGPSPDNPSELLSSERMAELLEEVATRYKDRLIILDSPPPSLTAESGALARDVDGILVVVKYGSTPKNQVTDLISKLGRKKIIGAVINNFDASTSRYKKKYYGGYYYYGNSK
jgi:exopolysaccharide/PEP-CTERM locus tyrosine autokinase